MGERRAEGLARTSCDRGDCRRVDADLAQESLAGQGDRVLARRKGVAGQESSRKPIGCRTRSVVSSELPWSNRKCLRDAVDPHPTGRLSGSAKAFLIACRNHKHARWSTESK